MACQSCYSLCYRRNSTLGLIMSGKGAKMSLRFQVARHMKLVRGVPSSWRGGGLGTSPPRKFCNIEAQKCHFQHLLHFPTADVHCNLHLAVVCFCMFQRFLLFLFPFHCIFFPGALLVLFYYESSPGLMFLIPRGNPWPLVTTLHADDIFSTQEIIVLYKI